LFIEALAYHESGHAVMAVLLDLPIAKVGIGPGCDNPGFNGKVDLNPDGGPQPAYKVALLEVASERAERLCPRYDLFRSIHKKHAHLKPFSLGLRGDLVNGFAAISHAYILLGLAKSTARQRFKHDYRDVAAALIDLNADAVRRLAERLVRENALGGADATAVILADGPLKRGRHLDRFGRAVCKILPAAARDFPGLPS
jgi:hypothetical protein